MKAYEAIQILEVLDPNTEVALTLPGVKKTKPPLSGIPQWDHRYYPPTFVPNWMHTPQYNVTCKTVH